MTTPVGRFRTAYATHRAREGRALAPAQLAQLPYLKAGPLARQWSVRARTFDRFVDVILLPRASEVAPRAVTVLDAGAGNGWLCHRVLRLGHRAIALDLRTDAVDGLGAAATFAEVLADRFPRVAAAFEAVPLPRHLVDIAVFNASLHYAVDLRAVLAEAARLVIPGGRIAVLDSPFYTRASGGEAMVAEKRGSAAAHFGDLAGDLLALPFVEYLTGARLANASCGLGLTWRRHRVRYPLWYELRPFIAALLGRRPPSRFDLWEATVA